MSKNNNVLNQYSLFDYMNMGVKTNISIKKPIRLIEFFSGIGTQFQALHRIGANVESHCISDWDINSNKSYKAMHETLTEKVDDYDYSKDLSQDEVIEKLNNLCLSVNGKDPIDKKFIKRKGEAWQRKTYNEFKANNNLGSITRVHADELNIVDKDKYTYMMFYSFPCLTGDTEITMYDGRKEIKDIKVGDYVLTHKNRLDKVIASKMTGYKQIFEVKTTKATIKCTSNHKFYTCRKDNDLEWIEAKDLLDGDYLAFVSKENDIYEIEWIPFLSYTDLGYKDYVYDIEVEHDHSFVANGVIVHNCTDLSLAGKQMGMKKGSGTRSGLLWEVERILKETVEHELELPDILMMENVPQVCSGKNKEDFDDWKEFLSSLGYSNFHDILNACDYGVPQNRKRCFMVSILDKNATYTFPKKIPLTRCVKDILEQNVDEKYYINNEKAEELIKSLLERGVLPNPKDIICVDGTINKPGERNVANCIPARYDSGIGNLRSSGNMVISQRPCIVKDQGKTFGKDIDVASTLLARDYKGLNNRGSNAVIEGKINVVGQLPTGGQRGRVYDSNGILGTLTATEFKDPSKVIEPSIMKYDVETKVKVRKYDLDVNELCNLLRYKRAEKHLTNKEIADALNIPLTKVSHYFRNDRCFAIPDENIWYKLKDLLGIETDKFDKAITEFEIKSSNYDKTNKIYNENGCSPTINTCGGGNHEPKIIDATIVALRGRPIENPNIRQAGLPTKQRLEINKESISNTLTTVQKDNLVLESTLYDDYNNNIPNEQRKIGAITPTCGNSTLRNGKKIIERVGQISSDGSQCGTVVSDKGLFPTVSAGCHGYANPHICTQYRIRKLTPKECGRLMDVTDDVIDAMSTVNSNSKLYQQFGNSIVIAVLCALFLQLNIHGIENWNDRIR